MALAAGYHGGGKLRVGGGMSFTVMNLRLVESASDRIADNTGLRSLLVTSRVAGSSILLRGQGGAQYDMTPHWRVGGAVRTPGATIIKSATLTLDGLLDAGNASLGASLFDPAAEFAYHLPWELQGGAAFVHERAQFEVDVEGYTPISAYTMVSTSEPSVTYGDKAPTSALDRDAAVRRPAIRLERRGQRQRRRAHRADEGSIAAGSRRVATNQSPVNTADAIFHAGRSGLVDTGLSGSLAKLSSPASTARAARPAT